MPYIKQEKRKEFIVKEAVGEYEIDLLTTVGKIADCGGDLNYAFTVIAKAYMDSKGENYQNYSDVIAALEGAKLELYRRSVAPYEDKKAEENGDV